MPDNNHVKRPYISGTPVRPEDSKRSIADEEGITVEQKMAGSVLDLKKIYPFLFAALYVVPRIESEETGRIAVSLDKLYYNSEFIKSIPRSTLTFYIIHGLYHILMRHHIRGEGKDPLDWNKACDLYINRCIERTIGAGPGKGAVAVPDKNGDNVYVEMPENEFFDEEIDVEKDTPELIYARIHEDENKEEQESPDESGGQGESGESGDGEDHGQESDSGAGSDGSSEEESESGNEGSDDTSDDSEETSPDKNESETQDTDETDPEQDDGSEGSDDTSDESEGSESDGSSDTEETDSEESDSSVSESPETKENEESTRPEPDMIDDSDSMKDSATSKAQKLSRMLTKIDTINRQMSSGNFGRGTAYDPVADAEIHKNAEKINWRVLLQNRLMSMITDEKSLSHPDRRFVHTGLYLEGPVKEENRLNDIKICIDTSASMSDSDIATALFQIQNLLKQYKLEADLVFWDEEIESIMPFNDLREFRIAKSQAKGRGGTNPECIFEEFIQSNEKGHMAPNPRLVLIFTDGFFERPDRKYRRAFDNSTIWMLCSEESEKLEDFDPGFGKRIEMKIK